MRSERDFPWGQNQQAENIDYAKIPLRLLENNYCVVLIAGPNGAGKGTIIEGLLETKSGFSKVVRETTKSSDDSASYINMNIDTFLQIVEDKMFVEWGRYGQGLYGTSFNSLVKALEFGNRLLVDIDIDGGLILRNFFERLGIKVCDCFISPVPSDILRSEHGLDESVTVLLERMKTRARGESEQELEGRIKNARKTLTRANEFRYIIINDTDNISKAIGSIRDLL